MRAVRSREVALVLVPLLNELVDSVRGRCLPALLQRLKLSGAAAARNRAFLAAADALRCASAYCEKLRGVVGKASAEQFSEVAPMAEVSLDELRGLADRFADEARPRNPTPCLVLLLLLACPHARSPPRPPLRSSRSRPR